jgi:hypothetical protein
MPLAEQVEYWVRTHSGDLTEWQLDQAFGAAYDETKMAAIRDILETLRRDGKILFDCRGRIVWTHNPGLVREIMAKPHLRLA